MNARHFLLALVGLAVLAFGPANCPAADAKGLNNPFFTLDNGLRNARNNTPKARAETLVMFGFAGSDISGTKGIDKMGKAYDAKGVRLFATYNWLAADPSWQPDEGMKQAIKTLKGHDGWIWVAMHNKKYKPSNPAGDADALPMLRRLADLAAKDGVRVALYPHANAWVERTEDAIRLARKTGRDNVGGTFNLCHFLQVNGDTAKLPKLLKNSMDKLFAVTVSGADADTKGWPRLIQPLGRGTFDMDRFLRTLRDAGYKGPVGLQSYGIKGDSRSILGESISAWNSLKVQVMCPRVDFIQPFVPVPDGGTLVVAGTVIAVEAEREMGVPTHLLRFAGDRGDWLTVGEVMLDPNNKNRLIWQAGADAVVNGKKGRTRHLVTKAEHGDCRAHIEFMVPKGSNSGVYFQGRYEIQVLDSWGVKSPKHGDCGGVYQRWKNNKGYEGRPPRVNASLQPGQWQTFDVWFRAPRFDKSGKKTANACFVKVIHNGKVVHENQPVTGPTRSAMFNDEKPLGPMMFQGDHGPVAYRRCWIVMGDIPAPSGPSPAVPLAGRVKSANGK